MALLHEGKAARPKTSDHLPVDKKKCSRKRADLSIEKILVYVIGEPTVWFKR